MRRKVRVRPDHDDVWRRLFAAAHGDARRTAQARAGHHRGDPVVPQGHRSRRAGVQVAEAFVQWRPGASGEAVRRARLVREHERGRPLRHRHRQGNSQRRLQAPDSARSARDAARQVRTGAIGEQAQEAVRALVVPDRISLPAREAAPVVSAQLGARVAQIRGSFRAPAGDVPAVAGEVLGDLGERLVDPGLLRPLARELHAARDGLPGTKTGARLAVWRCPTWDYSTAKPPERSGCGDDAREVLGLQARAADERTVDVRPAEQIGGVLRFARPAVLDAHRGGDLKAGELPQQSTDLAVHFLRLSGRCRLPGADGPDGLVGDGAPADRIGLQTGEYAAHLAGNHFPRPVRVALLERLADADDGMELRLEGGAQLAVHGLVGLSEVLPALAVSEDHAVAADLGQHGRAHLAGEGALLLVVAVLREELG